MTLTTSVERARGGGVGTLGGQASDDRLHCLPGTGSHTGLHGNVGSATFGKGQADVKDDSRDVRVCITGCHKSVLNFYSKCLG